MGVHRKTFAHQYCFIPKAKNIVLSYMRKQIGDGSSTLFWFNIWMGCSSLKALYPRLFLLSTNPSTSMGFFLGMVLIVFGALLRSTISSPIMYWSSKNSSVFLVKYLFMRIGTINLYGPRNKVVFFPPSNHLLMNSTKPLLTSQQLILRKREGGWFLTGLKSLCD